MKTLLLSAAALPLFAAPAAAETIHRTSLTHEGRTVSLSYEPKAETTFRQLDIGPRSSPRCTWSTRVSVLRTATGADSRPIAALTRAVGGEAKPRRGSDLGYCASLSRKSRQALGVSDAELRAIGAEAARNDSAALRSELASLDTFHAAHAR